MSWTAWHELMSDTTRSERVSAKLADPELSKLAACGLTLFGDLERNLLASQRALVSGDLSRLEELTREQALFQHKLAGLVASGPAAPVSNASVAMQHEIREAQLRILHLGRLHMALLARREQSLRTLRHRIAGTHSLYGPPAARPRF